MKSLLLILILILTSQIVPQSSLENGINLFNQEKYSAAKEAFESILEKNDNNAEAHLYLAKCLFELGDLDEAIEHGEKAVELDDNNADFHFELGLLYAEDARDASIFRAPFVAGNIKEQFKRTIELDPDHLQGRIGLAEFYLQAPGIAGGDVDKALEHAKIVETMNEMQGGFLLARIYIEKESFSKAEGKLKNLESKYGEDSEFYYFYNIYGYFLINQNRVDEAIEKFKKQITLAPKEANPYDSLGEAYKIKGMLKQSLQQYQKAYSISPSERVEEIIEELKEEIDSK
ncbi:MAG: tetratricopeptide repeat protein [Ignavibacteriaceae bacterium]|nr:tetratricopeptide repeat protein [Ignavibacteria bacterium]MBT8392493.1 tetratricopeptide repeat protein [Ignavibacteria bacterium]NNJ53570.1 tetratricopeptide repeat protein [Ignavibacteriaceae bacterium]NNL22072.1 tetratricopeptide repeat protein [Ignavibacteriaceae bacterium]